MGKISSKIFLPTKELTELDLSDCDLRTTWAETNIKVHSNNIFKNLKLLNISNNEIEHIHQSDFDVMDQLSMLDVSNNKIHCDKNLTDLIKWFNQKKVIEIN